MNVYLGAFLSVLAAGVTGWIDSRLLRPAPSSRRTIAAIVFGALVGVLAYGAFLVAGFVIALFTFGEAVDPVPALISVVLGCAVYLLFRWVERLLVPRFGLPERRASSGRRNLDDLLNARARGGSTTMWLGGVGLPLLPIVYGVRCMVTGKGELGTHLWPSQVEGPAAVALGLGWIAVGLFLHFHFFFGLNPALEPHSRNGKRISMIVAAVGLGVAGAWSVISRVP